MWGRGTSCNKPKARMGSSGEGEQVGDGQGLNSPGNCPPRTHPVCQAHKVSHPRQPPCACSRSSPPWECSSVHTCSGLSRQRGKLRSRASIKYYPGNREAWAEARSTQMVAEKESPRSGSPSSSESHPTPREKGWPQNCYIPGDQAEEKPQGKEKGSRLKRSTPSL